MQRFIDTLVTILLAGLITFGTLLLVSGDLAKEKAVALWRGLRTVRVWVMLGIMSATGAFLMPISPLLCIAVIEIEWFVLLFAVLRTKKIEVSIPEGEEAESFVKDLVEALRSSGAKIVSRSKDFVKREAKEAKAKKVEAKKAE